MQRTRAWTALALGWAFLGVAHAQETYRVDIDVSARVVCVWTESVHQKMVGVPLPPNNETIEETRYTTITSFRRDGPDLLIADIDPEYPEEIVFLRFGPGGVLLAAAIDQGSLEEFAAASRSDPRPMDLDAQAMGDGLYEAAIDGRNWALGDPLYTQHEIRAWEERGAKSIPEMELRVAIDSQVVLVEAPLSAEGRRQLVFAGPITITSETTGSGADVGIFLQSRVQVRVVIDQATGHLVEAREAERTSAGDRVAFMSYTTAELSGVCRSEPLA